jgi:hypothetical protein
MEGKPDMTTAILDARLLDERESLLAPRCCRDFFAGRLYE